MAPDGSCANADGERGGRECRVGYTRCERVGKFDVIPRKWLNKEPSKRKEKSSEDLDYQRRDETKELSYISLESGKT